MKHREVAGAKVQGSPFKRRLPAAIAATLPGVQRGFVAVGQTPPGSSNLARDRAADISLMFALLVAAAMAGGGIYEAFVLFPAWSAGAAKSAGMISAGTATVPLSVALGRFWLGCYSVAAASLLLALVFNWSWNWRRTMVLLALGSFAAMRAWTYFSLRPELDELLNIQASAATSAELIDRVVRWAAQNRWRELVDCLVVASLAVAFGMPARLPSRTGVRAAGLYRKASK